MTPIINCHTHIFNGDCIPPYIAKKFVPWPLYYATNVHALIWLYRLYDKLKRKLEPVFNKKRKVIGWLKSHYITDWLYTIFIFSILLLSILFLIDLFNAKALINFIIVKIENYDITTLLKNWIVSVPFWNKIYFIIIASFISSHTRNIVIKLLFVLVKPLTYLPKSISADFLSRYLTIVEFNKYKKQEDIYKRLYKMYPPESAMIVLPMDMEYMGCGTPPKRYLTQLQEINNYFSRKSSPIYRNKLLPFIFVDPRRLGDDRQFDNSQERFFKWSWDKDTQQVILQDCLLKTYLEKDPSKGEFVTGNFKGIKLYPALGYYPFDAELLPLFLYCVQHDIPITTHCTIGTIFNRSTTNKKWLNHPVFVDKHNDALETPFKSSFESQRNFTHPLNYLVLLEPYYLRKILAAASKEIKDSKGNTLQEIFGYTKDNPDLLRNLSNLKINIAHFGGSEEWRKYLESDRQEESQELTERPNFGLELLHTGKQEVGKENLNYNKPEDLWSKADWYTIICSMMIRYPNVYADLSYILHNQDLLPLLKSTLRNPLIARRILFGTDFYVVRNHKSEKQFTTDLMAGLSDRDFNAIARVNPKQFLNTHLNN